MPVQVAHHEQGLFRGMMDSYSPAAQASNAEMLALTLQSTDILSQQTGKGRRIHRAWALPGDVHMAEP